MLQRVNVVAIIRKNGKVLVLKRSKWNKIYRHSWQMPEGGVEFGETLQRALARELKEETDLKLKKCELIAAGSSTINYFTKRFWHFIRIFYKCDVGGSIKLSKAHEEYRWVTKTQLKKLPLVKGFNYSQLEKWL